MKKILLVFLLIFSLNVRPEIDSEAAFFGVITWLIVSPIASFHINTSPTCWEITQFLLRKDISAWLKQDYASRCALGGIIAGTAGTLAGLTVYHKLASSNK